MSDTHEKATKEPPGTGAGVKALQVSPAAFLRCRGAMTGIVRSMGINGSSVEDVVHDAFEAACRKAETDRPDPADETRFRSWLCTLAKFAVMNTRNEAARSKEAISPTDEIPDISVSHRAYISHHDDKVAAAVVFASLSADDRALLYQHFYEDKTVKELAEEHGVPWTTMNSRIESALHRARAIMFDDGSNRRRGAGGIVLAALGLWFRELYVRVQSLWGSSKRTALLLGVGVGASATVAALLWPQLANLHDFALAAEGAETTATGAAGLASYRADARVHAAVNAHLISVAAVAVASAKSPRESAGPSSGSQSEDRSPGILSIFNSRSRKNTSNP